MDKDLLYHAYDLLENKNNDCIKTGFRDLDCMLSNLDKGSVVTIGGRPAMGKTSLATSILFNLLENGKKCMYYILDISTESFIQRLLISKAEVCYYLLRQGKLDNKDWEKLAHAMNYFIEKSLYIHDEAVGVNDIKKHIEEVQPEYVFIDYLQIIKSTSKKQKNDIINEMVAELKQIAKDNNCIIFVLSTLSRAVESRFDKRPMLSDLRDGGGIEDISDVVLLIYRDEYYNNNEDEKEKRYAEIIIAKNKLGPIGTVILKFKGKYVKFEEPINIDVF